MELSSEQFGHAFNKAPRPVRSFIVDGGLDEAIQIIAKARGLHVDVTGLLENCTSYMLVGLMNPAQVLGELVLAGVDAETGKSTLEDLNSQIFKPVREKVEHFTETGEDLISPKFDDDGNLIPVGKSRPENGTGQKPMQQQPPAGLTAMSSVEPPTASTSLGGAPVHEILPSPRMFTGESSDTSVVTNTPPPAVFVPPTSRTEPVTVPATLPEVLPGPPSSLMHTMANDIRQVKEGVWSPVPDTPEATDMKLAPSTEPQRPIHEAPVAPKQEPVVQLPSFGAPPSNLPGTAQSAKGPIMKEYSVDPYRESLG